MVPYHVSATYAWNIKREEEHVDFNRTAKEVYNHIRGLYPFPTANMILNDAECKVLEAYIGDKMSNFSHGTIADITKDAIGITTRDNMVYITRLKPYGKKEMTAADYLNGVDKSKFLHSIVK